MTEKDNFAGVTFPDVTDKYERILVIGDIHGNFDRLLSVYRKAKWRPQEDLLILLGDYVDRGPESGRSLRWAMEMSEKENTVVLRGNHEQMMLAYYLLEGDADIWLPNGGDKTKRDPDALKKALKFIAARPLYHCLRHSGRDYMFVHAGINPWRSFAEQTSEHFLWIREEFYRNYTGRVQIVAGHTPTQYLFGAFGAEVAPVRLDNNIILMDTGSFLPRGRISCMDVLSGRFWQSDE